MTEEIKVRVGTLADLDEMMELAMMATDENAFAKPSPQKLLADIYPALMQQHGIVGIIGDHVIEGAVLLRIGSPWYSEDVIIEEKAVFVHPDYRAAKGGRAARLCEFAKKVSDDLGIPLAMGVMSSERTAAKIRTYGRIFGAPSGAYWLYGTTTGAHGGMSH